MVGKLIRAMDSKGMFKDDREKIAKIDALTDSSYMRLMSL